jgi:hypothetical protein
MYKNVIIYILDILLDIYFKLKYIVTISITSMTLHTAILLLFDV